MKRYMFPALLVAMLSAPAFAGKPEGGMMGGGMMGGGMMDMPMMKEHLSQMQEHLDTLKAAKTDQEKMSLMQDHMQLMHDHMKMMMDMMGGKGMAPDKKPGAPAKAAPKAAPPRPEGISEEEHKKHHPEQ